MKKTIVLLFFVVISYVTIGKLTVEQIVIPNEAIRLRVLANSNSEYDQQIKEKVRDQVQEEIFQLLKGTKGINEARQIISKNKTTIDQQVHQLLLQEKYPLNYQVDFGQHLFPEKTFKGITYDDGYYESLLITLGSGKGSNWWCVLFPPLCMLEAEESSEVEYRFWIEEVLDKYL